MKGEDEERGGEEKEKEQRRKNENDTDSSNSYKLRLDKRRVSLTTFTALPKVWNLII